jgi:uncharacterized surface protein with fasciclin (FAS1) repeats
MGSRPWRRCLSAAFVTAAWVGLSAPHVSQAGGAAVVEPTDPQGPFCSSIPAAGEGSFAGMADDPVATAASNNPYLTTLTSAVAAAGLTETLNGEGPFTILAPSNEAFARVPPADLDAILDDPAALVNILTYHVIAGRAFSAAELIAEGRVESAQGSELIFTSDEAGALIINGGAAISTCWNIRTANATVHVIDRLLVPPSPDDCFAQC